MEEEDSGSYGLDHEIWSAFAKPSAVDNDVRAAALKQQLEALCTHCSAGRVVLDQGNYVCQTCNTVNDRFIDMSAEWRFFGGDDGRGGPDTTRCGMPVNELLPNSSYGTMVSYSYRESYEMRYLRKYQLWNSMTYRERTLYNVFETLTLHANTHGIPKSIIEQAKVYYKQLSELKVSRGSNRSGLIASSIYMACKREHVPRSAKEIAKIFNLDLTTMTRGCKRFQELLKVDVDCSTADDFVARFCSAVNLTRDQRTACRRLVQHATEQGWLSENAPPSVAASCIYACSALLRWGHTKKSLCEAFDISQVTVTKCHKKLQAHRAEVEQLLLPAA